MASPKDFVPVLDSEVPHFPGATVAARARADEVAEVTVVVKAPNSSPSISSFLSDMAGLGVRDRQYLSQQALGQIYGASTADLKKIERFASLNQLSVVGAGPSRRAVTLLGTVGNLGKAFNVELATYRSSRGTYRGYSGPVQVPQELASLVQGVFGLSTRPQSTFHLRKKQAVPSSAQGRSRTGTGTAPPVYTPVEVSKLYKFPTDVDGKGQCIGIIEFGGGYRMDDLKTYFQQLGIATPNIVSVSIGGAFNAPTGDPNGPDAEVALDIEVAGAIAPAAQIVVYFAPNTSLGWVRGVSAAIHDSFHKPSVISISWGGPEETWSRQSLRVLNSQFQAAAAMGITICCAAGDNGSSDGVPGTLAHVDFPASSPYVLACGGTRLEGSNDTIAAESVWFDGPNSATGGGISSFFALPSYQKGANVPVSVNPPHKAGRGVPDVAGDADPNTGYRVRVDGSDFVIGGTSAVAPLWAGLLALVNQKIGKSSGYLNPRLYKQGVSGGGFNDITHGSNGAYNAGPGWDPCTGLGSPVGTILAGIV